MPGSYAGLVIHNSLDIIDASPGRASPDSVSGGFRVASLVCYADCDTSTGLEVLDVFDFLCFLNHFAANDLYACKCDVGSGPNTCDIFDLLCSQNAYDAGCP